MAIPLVLGMQSQVCDSSCLQDSMIAPMQAESRHTILSFMQSFLERKNLSVHGLIYAISFAI